MKESEDENQHGPLSYHGAWRIVWLIFLLLIVWLILRALQPVVLLFALVFLLAMVLNPIGLVAETSCPALYQCDPANACAGHGHDHDYRFCYSAAHQANPGTGTQRP